MKVALVSPWNPKETAIAGNQIDYFKCISEFVDIDYFSNEAIEIEGISVKKLEIEAIKKYDVVHFQWGNNPLHFFEFEFLIKMKLLKMDKPIVSTIHEVDLQYLLRAHKDGRLFRYLLTAKYFTHFYQDIFKRRILPDILTTLEIVNCSDISIFNSNYAKNRMLKECGGFKIKKDKIITAKLGIDSRRFEISKTVIELPFSEKMLTNRKIFLYVGFLHEIKSIDLLLKAFYYIEKYAKRNDFFFLVIGDGPDRMRLQELANKWLPKNSYFMGFVKDIIPYYKRADVVLNPRRFSRGETSMAIPEAFASGKPMVAPNLGCNNEYITNDLGYLTKNNDEIDYMDAIMNFLGNPDEISRCGANAKKFATESLDWRSQAKTFIEQYEKVFEIHKKHS